MRVRVRCVRSFRRVRASQSQAATSLIFEHVLSSRKQILAFAEGVHQTEAANKMEIAAFRRPAAGASS